MISLIDGVNYARIQLETARPGMSSMRWLFERSLELLAEGPVVWVWDGPHALNARRQLYPEYKAKRKPAGEDIWASIDTLKQLLTLAPVIQVEVPGYEADDVIAHLAQQYPDCRILSNDKDFLQLGVPVTEASPSKVPTEWIRLYKTVVGDPSDNIPGIKGFGQGAWEQWTDQDRADFQAWLERGTDDGIAVPLPPASLNWFQDPDNRQLVRTFYRIVGFLYVMPELIDQHMTVGVDKREAARAILKEHLFA